MLQWYRISVELLLFFLHIRCVFLLYGYTSNMKKNILYRFLLCGFAGWSMECLWTGIHTMITTADKTLPCRSSIWMFPIYGMAALIYPLSNILKGKSIITRGGIYTILIFLVEFGTGTVLNFFQVCPWNYSEAKLQIRGVIRLDYAPIWFGVGLFYEKLLRESYKWSLYRSFFHKERKPKKVRKNILPERGFSFSGKVEQVSRNTGI